MAAVGEDGELDPRGTAVVEERVDRRADRAAGVEDVVDEDARHALEREVEARRADKGLGVLRRFAGADVHVVAMEGDVELPERGLVLRKLGYPPPQPLGQRDAARVDADEGEALEVGVPLDDLVRDPRQRALDRLGVENDLRGGCARSQGALRARLTFDSFPASRDRVKGVLDPAGLYPSRRTNGRSPTRLPIGHVALTEQGLGDGLQRPCADDATGAEVDDAVEVPAVDTDVGPSG